MKKSIDQIINNENYVKLNDALKDRSEEIAHIVRKELVKLEIEEIGDYSVRTVITRAGGSDTSLYILDEDGKYRCLELEKSQYLEGDFNCWIDTATTKQRIQFLNSAREILDRIDEIKNKRCEQIEAALANTSDIK